MHLESQVSIHRPPDYVGCFLSDVSNISRWDRGVAEVKQCSDAPMGVGSDFETFAPADLRGIESDRGRMAYRVAEVGKDYCKVQLTSSEGNARFFKNAEWTFHTKPDGEGTVLTCAVDFALRRRYFLLAPVLVIFKGAIRRDLQQLKRVLEESQ